MTAPASPFRPGRISRLLPATAALLMLGGCNMATLPSMAFSGGDGSGAAPADDGTQCYATARAPFYSALAQAEQAAQTRVAAESMSGMVRAGQQVWGQLGRFGGGYGGGGSGMGSMLGLAGQLSNLVARANDDRPLIVNVTARFNELVACRRQEAARLQTDARARRISASEANAQIRRLRGLLEVDAQRVSAVNRSFTQRNADFLGNAEVAESQARSQPTAQAQQQGRREAQDLRVAVQTNQRALQEQNEAVDRALSGWAESALPGTIRHA